MSVKVYGASDDLIEIEGDINEEFYKSSDTYDYIAFSTGAVLTIKYDDDGIWKIRQIHKGDGVDITQCPPEEEQSEGDDRYSDVAEVYGVIKWVVCGNGYASKVSR